jgi:hypothetical protein
MILPILQGGLGNQLFQIFTTIAYSMKNNIPFVFLKKDYTIGITERKTYWNTFFYPLYRYLINHWQRDVGIKEVNFDYHELPDYTETIDINIELQGYFQSPKYFEDYYTDIYKLLELDKQKQLVSKKINLDYNNTISMHFRLGDYVKLPHVFHLLKLDYYKNALKFILLNIKQDNTNNNTINVLYFCEENDKEQVNIIINQLKNEFSNINFECVLFFLQDWEQMLLMSCCRYNIIANSTFSWWGAYFNDFKDKIVCYPNKWFVEGNGNPKTNDLFPSNWNMVL